MSDVIVESGWSKVDPQKARLSPKMSSWLMAVSPIDPPTIFGNYLTIHEGGSD